MATPRRLLILADGSPAIGMGHLKREADLLNALQARSAWRGWLATRDSSPEAISFFQQLAQEVDVVEVKQPGALDRLIDAVRPDLATVDFLNGSFDASCEVLAASETFTIGVGDWSIPRPCRTTLVLNANPCQVEAKQAFYASVGVTALLGPDYFMASPAFTANSTRARLEGVTVGPVRELLVALGGGDEQNVLDRLLEVLVPLATTRGIHLRVLQSPVALFVQENRRRFGQPGVEFMWNVKDMVPLLQQTDLLIASHGNIAYESAILGVPMIALNLVVCQDEQAQEMSRCGAVVNLGMGQVLERSRVLDEVVRVLDDPALRALMSQRRRELVDGRGLARLIAAIDERL